MRAERQVEDADGNASPKTPTRLWLPRAPERGPLVVARNEVERPTWIDAVLVGAAPTSPLVRLEPGVLVAGTRYRIVRWLGEGGMGVVYEAEHVDIERRVALKVLRPEYCRAPAAKNGFRDEARAIGRIGSDHIVAVYDFTELPDGRLAIAMELLDGYDLTVFRGQAVPPARALGILRQVCRGLAAAHASGVVHRDVKPENIFLHTRRGRPDAVKIVDFGIAAMTTNDGGALVPAGTPYYVAPETILLGAATPSVDMYSLGCLAYELLTGRVPFEDAELAKLLDMHVQEAPRPLAELVPECPKELAAVVMRCLAKQPCDRYEDMHDLEAALCEAQLASGLRTEWDDLTLPEVDPVRREQLQQLVAERVLPKRRRTSWWVTGIAAAALLILGGVGQALLWPRSGSVDAQVEQAVDDARAAAARALFVYPPADAPGEPTAYRLVRELEMTEGDDAPIARAHAQELRKELSQTLVRLGDEYWDRPGGQQFAQSYYAQALLFAPDHEHARERAEMSSEELAALGDKADRSEFTEAELREAEPLIVLAERDASKRARKVDDYRERRDQRIAAIDQDLETLATAEEKPKAAKSTPRLASASLPTTASGTVPPPPSASSAAVARDPKSARVRADKGKAALDRGDRQSAERLFEQALAQDSRNVTALAGLRDIHFDRGDYGRAVQYGERVIAQAPRSAAHRLRLGDAYYKVFRLRDAKAQYDKALALGDDRAKWRLEKVAAALGG